MSHFALKERYWVHALEKIGKIAFHMIQFWTLLEGGSGYLYIDISNISRGENSVRQRPPRPKGAPFEPPSPVCCSAVRTSALHLALVPTVLQREP